MQGNADAQRIFLRFGEALGILLADLVNVLDLDMYVIGGGVVSAWDAFAPRMFAELRERSLVYAASAPEDPAAKKEGARRKCQLHSARKRSSRRRLLGSDAGLYGAASCQHHLISAILSAQFTAKRSGPVPFGQLVSQILRASRCAAWRAGKLSFCSRRPNADAKHVGAPHRPADAR